MATFNANKFTKIILDGEERRIGSDTRYCDIVPENTSSVEILEPENGKTRLIPREDFQSSVTPGAYHTNQTAVEKGAVPRHQDD
ncbi:MAG: hypothetical protein LBT71_03520 [Azoarcus sp.]|jgi:hypothetical protein|nr:hypothetical protein [Azoarcus sp.]